MNCPSCGTENIEDAVYCMRCGRRLDGTAECPNCKKARPLRHAPAALLVFSIVLAALLTDAGVLAEVSVGYAVPAVLFVFSLLLPAADLVQAHLFRSGRNGQKAPSENADGQN